MINLHDLNRTVILRLFKYVKLKMSKNKKVHVLFNHVSIKQLMYENAFVGNFSNVIYF